MSRFFTAWRIAATLLGASVVAVAVALAGGWGPVYIAVYLLATLPGWPLGKALFGHRHAAGWIVGVVVGYALTSLALAASIRMGFQSGVALASAWAFVSGLSWLLAGRLKSPLITVTHWTARDTTALCLVLLLVPALMGPVYRHVGLQDANGNRYYRAYFTADFLWHEALTNELRCLALPPTNPFLAQETLHYYWSYFMVPATVAARLDRSDLGTERSLKLNALCSGVAFIATIFLTAWVVVPRALPVALAVMLAVLASSAEGLYAAGVYAQRGETIAQIWARLQNMNVDAVTNWRWGGLRVDGLARSLWYVPQHAAACALGLSGLLIASTAGATMALAAALTAGLALGLAVTFSPLLGAAFALIYGMTILIDTVRTRRFTVRAFVPHLVAACLFLSAIVWCIANEMFEGAGNALHFGMAGPARKAPLLTLAVGLGPLILAALAGVWPLRRFSRGAVTAALAVLVGLWLMYYVLLVPDQYWVGFRAGQILLIMLPVFAARFFSRALSVRVRWPCIAVTILLFMAGLPTTLVDAFDAQDTSNNRMGPGFHWTIHLTPQQQEALSWIRRETPATAVVQMDALTRGRDTWTLIPTFASRRMAAGLYPVSLVHIALSEERARQVHTLYRSENAAEAWEIAQTLGIDYIYLDAVEKADMTGPALEKFEHNSNYFAPVFRNREVVVFSVVKRPESLPAATVRPMIPNPT
jgi:hypothetical protein